MTNVQEYSSIEPPTPNMFSSSSNSNPTKSTIAIDVLAIGFNWSKHTIKSGKKLTSYLDAN